MADPKSKSFWELSALIAHEIRSPLAVLANGLSLLEHGTGAGPGLLEGMREEVSRIDMLVQDLLDFARPTEVAASVHDLSLLLGDVATAVRPSASAHGLFVVVEEGPELPGVLMDGRLMRHALTNLAFNGLQSMSPGGTLTLRAVLRAGHVCLEVQDEGPGIARGNRARIFEPFFGSAGSPVGTAGSGLGLALVKRVVEQHEGGLAFRNTPRGGACFVIELPLPPRPLTLPGVTRSWSPPASASAASAQR